VRDPRTARFTGSNASHRPPASPGTEFQSPAYAVFAFMADPANLARWAIGFAREVKADG
jgi:hypothetical protein